MQLGVEKTARRSQQLQNRRKRNLSVIRTLTAFAGRPFVKRFALCYRTVVCPVCLSETFVYCGQTVRWIKMKLGMEVGLGPGHNVLDEDPPPTTLLGL